MDAVDVWRLCISDTNHHNAPGSYSNQGVLSCTKMTFIDQRCVADEHDRQLVIDHVYVIDETAALDNSYHRVFALLTPNCMEIGLSNMHPVCHSCFDQLKRHIIDAIACSSTIEIVGHSSFWFVLIDTVKNEYAFCTASLTSIR
jgi:hypothetical protein